jgi:hypothetical protein
VGAPRPGGGQYLRTVDAGGEEASRRRRGARDGRGGRGRWSLCKAIRERASRRGTWAALDEAGCRETWMQIQRVATGRGDTATPARQRGRGDLGLLWLCGGRNDGARATTGAFSARNEGCGAPGGRAQRLLELAAVNNWTYRAWAGDTGIRPRALAAHAAIRYAARGRARGDAVPAASLLAGDGERRSVVERRAVSGGEHRPVVSPGRYGCMASRRVIGRTRC